MKTRSALVRRRARALLVSSALACLLIPALAHAEPAARPSERDQFVKFDDELLGADVSAPYGGPIFATHLPPARTLLIRPRTNFVPELYKSVEQI